MKNSTTDGNVGNWCETCDREFPTAEALSRHMQQHQKCKIDGCQFVAHPKVITKHIQMQHSSGLFKKIANLHKPEEIQKWREERKKKYPTRINIEKKAAERKEKVERGEKMALRDRNRNHQRSDQMKRTHNFDKKNRNHRPNKSSYFQRQNKNDCKDLRGPPMKKNPKMVPKIPSVVEKNKLLPFTGILGICIDDDIAEDNSSLSINTASFIEDDYFEENVDQPIEKAIQEPELCGALTSLLCDYGSSDEDENSIPIKMSATSQNNDIIKNNMQTVNKGNTKKYVNVVNSIRKEDLKNVPNGTVNEPPKTNNGENSDNDSGPEEVKIDKTYLETTPSEVVQNKTIAIAEVAKKKPLPVNDKKRTPLQNGHRHKYKHKIPSTLLHKLLHKEIRQERNIVLQCIRYIKKMNYFDKV